MSSINRATLPQNFLDSVSTGMRIPQPEPQYLFAKMAIASGISLAAIDAGAKTAQQFVSMAAGGAVVPPQLDELARVADALPKAVLSVNDFGKNQGDTIKLRRVVYEGGGYSESARRVQSDKPTSTTGQALKGEDVPMTLFEYEGPYSNDGSEVRPYAIREFDARYKANKDQLASLVSHHLVRDYTKWLDTVIRDLFRASGNITYGGAAANVGAFTNGANKFIDLASIMAARKALSDREVSPFQNGRYALLVPTAFNTQMIQDSIYRQLSQFKDMTRNQIFGYITTIQDLDIFECTTLKSYAAGETVDGVAVPASNTAHEALLIAPGAVGMGTAQQPQCFFADDTDFGKSAKVIWRAVQAFQTVDARFVQRLVFQG